MLKVVVSATAASPKAKLGVQGGELEHFSIGRHSRGEGGQEPILKYLILLDFIPH